MSQNITGIPADQVGAVVQDFVNDGATEIVAEPQPDGSWTVSAKF